MDSWRRAAAWPQDGRMWVRVYSVPRLSIFQDDIPEGPWPFPELPARKEMSNSLAEPPSRVAAHSSG